MGQTNKKHKQDSTVRDTTSFSSSRRAINMIAFPAVLSQNFYCQILLILAQQKQKTKKKFCASVTTGAADLAADPVCRCYDVAAAAEDIAHDNAVVIQGVG